MRYNTPADGKEISTQPEECVYPTYDHQNLFNSTLTLSAHYLPLKCIYQCEGLSSSLLKQVKMSTYIIVTLNLKNFTQYVLLMQVNNANILKPKGMLNNAIML